MDSKDLEFQKKLNLLKEMAHKASPGPWMLPEYSETIVLAASGRPISSSTHCTLYRPSLIDKAKGSDNAAFIAAANPAMILEMIRRIEDLENKRFSSEACNECVESAFALNK